MFTLNQISIRVFSTKLKSETIEEPKNESKNPSTTIAVWIIILGEEAVLELLSEIQILGRLMLREKVSLDQMGLLYLSICLRPIISKESKLT